MMLTFRNAFYNMNATQSVGSQSPDRNHKNHKLQPRTFIMSSCAGQTFIAHD